MVGDVVAAIVEDGFVTFAREVEEAAWIGSTTYSAAAGAERHAAW